MTVAGRSAGNVTGRNRRMAPILWLSFLLSTGLVGLVLIVAGLLALVDGFDDVVVLPFGLALCGLAWAVELRRPRVTRLDPAPTLAASVAGFVVVILWSFVVYLLTSALPSIERAMYEAVAGVATSSLTSVADPAGLSDAVLVFRAGTQWLGGLLAVVLAVGLLPFLGGSRELADPGRAEDRAVTIGSRPPAAVRRVMVIYGIVTAVVVAAYLAAGMGVVDAISYSFTSVSTGGFANHADSIAHFDSRVVELITMIVMFGAGCSVVIAWMLARREFRATRRAFELQVFVSALVVAVAVVTLLGEAPAGGRPGLRETSFTVVSLMTTTGHRVGDWGSWGSGSATLLLVLLTVGGMAGSVSGGLRWMRVVTLAQFLWRELQRQLHPNSVRAVKVGPTRISDRSVDRMHAQLVNFLLLATVGGIMLGLAGRPLTETITLSLSAVATAGPGFGVDGTVVHASDFSPGQRMALLPLMVAGRVFLYPAFVLAGVAWFGSGRWLSARRGNPGAVRRATRRSVQR